MCHCRLEIRRARLDNSESGVPFVDSWPGGSYNPRRLSV